MNEGLAIALLIGFNKISAGIIGILLIYVWPHLLRDWRKFKSNRRERKALQNFQWPQTYSGDRRELPLVPVGQSCPIDSQPLDIRLDARATDQGSFSRRLSIPVRSPHEETQPNENTGASLSSVNPEHIAAVNREHGRNKYICYGGRAWNLSLAQQLEHGIPDDRPPYRLAKCDRTDPIFCEWWEDAAYHAWLKFAGSKDPCELSIQRCIRHLFRYSNSQLIPKSGKDGSAYQRASDTVKFFRLRYVSEGNQRRQAQ